MFDIMIWFGAGVATGAIFGEAIRRTWKATFGKKPQA
jgi:hypothetical protein